MVFYCSGGESDFEAADESDNEKTIEVAEREEGQVLSVVDLVGR